MTSVPHEQAVVRRTSMTAQLISPGVLMLAICVAAVAMRYMLGTNTDVSWALTMVEKILDGQRLYRDIVETNPPATAFLYVPPVMIARAIGAAPETVVDALVLLATALSLGVAGLVGRQSFSADGRNGWFLVACTLAILLILPAQTFGQREHIATIVLLPWLVLLCVRARGGTPSLAAVMIAGIGAGITVIIKPPFALAIASAIFAAAWSARSWRTIFAMENWIAGTLAVGYAAYVVWAFPEYVHDILPLAQAVYLPVRKSFLFLVTRPAVFCWAVMLGIVIRWKGRALLDSPVLVLLAASFGFALAYLIQGKGWPYHTYPMLALGFLAVAVAGLEAAAEGHGARPTRKRQLAPAFPIAAVAVISVVWLNIADSARGLIEPIRQIKDHPRMLIVTSDLSAGHPLVRQLGGTWVSRVAGLWIAAGAFQRLVEEKLPPEDIAALRRLAMRDRDMLAEDIERGRPDIIVVERGVFDWEAWMLADPILSDRTKAYREAARVGAYVILKRTRPDGAG